MRVAAELIEPTSPAVCFVPNDLEELRFQTCPSATFISTTLIDAHRIAVMANACRARLNDRQCCRTSQPNRSAPALAYDKFAAASEAKDERSATDLADFIVLIIGQTARSKTDERSRILKFGCLCQSA